MFVRTRLVALTAALACLFVVSASALATDDPPQQPPPPATTPADPTAADPAITGIQPCKDTTRPHSRVVTSARQATKKHKLSGVASDQGCTGAKVAVVSVSVSHKQGKRCQFLARARLSKATSCKKPRWVSAKGGSNWSLQLPRKLPRGSYTVLTRAVDSAGNVERAHARRLALR